MKKYLWLLALVLLSLIPLVDLFKSGLPLTHDGVDHVARIANFYQSLIEGNIVPRWAGNLNWGFGHPILMFLYPLPSYTASFFHFLGISLVDSTKIVFAAGYIISGMTMYLWLQTFLSKKAAFVGALSYMFAPYRLVDLYVRGAIGEHVAFIFPPLICYAISSLSVSKKSFAFVIGALSTAGLLLSHNAISVMFLPLIAFYAIYIYYQGGKQNIFLLKVFLFILLGFALSAFFWMPAFLEGKYTLRDIVTGNEYQTRFETWGRFLYSPWSYGGTGQFSVQVGIMQWIGVLLSPYLIFSYYKKKSKFWIFGFAAVVIFFLTLFFMTYTALPIWEKVTLLQKFQFPWRLLSVVVLLSSLLLALFVNIFKEKKQTISVVFIACLLIIFNANFWHAKDYLLHPESYYKGIYNGTTDTGESAPIWSVRFMEKRAKAQTYPIEGDARILPISRNSTSREYRIIAKIQSRIVENTLYFPGWNVKVNGENVPLEFQDQRYRGLITYFVPKGESRVRISFAETKLRLVADVITILGIVLLALYEVYLVLPKIWRRSQ